MDFYDAWNAGIKQLISTSTKHMETKNNNDKICVYISVFELIFALGSTVPVDLVGASLQVRRIVETLCLCFGTT